MGRFRDRTYPYFFGLVIIILAYYFKLNPKIKGFDNVLNGIISFSSIVLGFVAALLAIILSISKSPVMEHLYSYTAVGGNLNGKKLLFGYFKSALFSGFGTVILSIYMYIIDNHDKLTIFDKSITYIWIGITTLFVLSSYRIVAIIMFTLFKHEEHQSTSYEQATQPETDYSQLQQRNMRNIDSE